MEAAGLSGAYLHDLVDGNDVALQPVCTLLAAMQKASRPVNPASLGILGRGHIEQHLVEAYGIEGESIRYKKVEGTVDGLPYVLEVGFGWLTDYDEYCQRVNLIGINWTPVLKNPFPKLPTVLAEVHASPFDPVLLVVHVATPLPRFTDRGKASLSLSPEIQGALADAITAVTKEWTKLKRQADREGRVQQRDKEHALRQHRRQFPNLKAASYQVMEEAYMKASAGGRLPANARQVMYAARPLVLELTGGNCWKDSAYFTQQLLPNFVEEHPPLTAEWDVVFDARGHIEEPHTGKRVDLGTIDVREYREAWQEDFPEEMAVVRFNSACSTMGPAHRYAAVLFIEKEGFNPLLKAARIAEKYDLAIMSTKGMSTTASRQLVAQLSAEGVKILVLHDFDKSGFSIVHTLRTSTRRHQYETAPNVIDLGLRLEDVKAMQLQSEAVTYDSKVDPRENLLASGATQEEADYLVSEPVRNEKGAIYGWTGKRVELNAMTSQQLIDWLETKLQAHVQKVIPPKEVIEKAYRRARRRLAVEEAVEKVIAELATTHQNIAIPDDLHVQLREQLTTDGAVSWDEALWRLVRTNGR